MLRSVASATALTALMPHASAAESPSATTPGAQRASGDPEPLTSLADYEKAARLVHPDGEIATARGAAAASVTMIVSSFATVKVDDVARAASGAPLWFQLYVQPDRGFTRALVERAEASGCQALCVTVDTPVLGARNRETRVAFKLPDGMTRANLEGLAGVAAHATHWRSGDRTSTVSPSTALTA